MRTRKVLAAAALAGVCVLTGCGSDGGGRGGGDPVAGHRVGDPERGRNGRRRPARGGCPGFHFQWRADAGDFTALHKDSEMGFVEMLRVTRTCPA